MSSVNNIINQRNYENADQRPQHHRADHGYGERTLQLAPEVVGEEHRQHRYYGGQGGHDDGPEASFAGGVYGAQEGHPLFAEGIDGVELEDGVVDDDSTRDDDSDGRHDIERESRRPEHDEGECHVDGNLKQHYQRLQETLELCAKDKIHQNDRHQQDEGHLLHHF